MSRQIVLESEDDFDEWRAAARRCLIEGLAPHHVTWSNTKDGTSDLFDDGDTAIPQYEIGQPRVPPHFIELAKSVCLHSSDRRHAILYRLLWRLQAQPRLIQDTTDADVRSALDMAKSVRRDIHKMRAFVRFRKLETDGDERDGYAAWFEPDHFIERANAPFFVRRFSSMNWTIVTPRVTMVWDGGKLMEGEGGSRGDVPQDDDFEALWKDYYASIFNPARLKVKAMLKEMPRRYWKNMPEASLIPELIAGAQSREASMVDRGAAPIEEVPNKLEKIRELTAKCTRCPLYCDATQAVNGEGPEAAYLMIVGEQPGDQEDIAGRPFVGPAGQLLNAELERAAINRSDAFVTNAVRHFKHEKRGKVRLHKNPNANEIDHCRWWLDAERNIVKPKVILALGASAARGVLGRTDSVKRLRAEPLQLQDGTVVCTTYHPSYFLRLQGNEAADRLLEFRSDLERCASFL